MKAHPLTLAAALAIALALTPWASRAQVSETAPPAGAASAAPASKTGPRLLTPAESRDRANEVGDLRPERPVMPQISIPFGKGTAAPVPKSDKLPPRRSPPAAPAAAGGVDEAVARCEAQVSDAVRAQCRAKLAVEERARKPG